MYGQAHCALGWLAGTAVPGTDRRLRNWCVFAAIAPDIDTVSFLFGHDAYNRWHHTFGHNVWFGALLTAAALWHHRDRGWGRRIVASLLTAACFLSHLVTDGTMTGWPLMPFWPVSRADWMWSQSLQLSHPLNAWAVYVGIALIAPLAYWRGATPLDIVSPRLDRLVLGAFRRRTLSCTGCSGPCNLQCDGCTKPVCMRHGRVRWGFRVHCAACAAPPAA